MTFAIFSDLHDNVANLDKILNYCKGKNINTLICAGDLANRETFNHLLKNFSGNLYYIFGNNEVFLFQPQDDLDEIQKENPNIKIFNDVTGDFNLENLKIGITHFPEKAEEMAQAKKYDLIFFGHTHRPDIQEFDKTLLLNPGEAGGAYQKATFAIFDTETKKSKLILLENLK